MNFIRGGNPYKTLHIGKNALKTLALEWWNNMPMQNLKDMNESWVGYTWKYYPDYTSCQLNDDEILHVWTQENKKIKNKK